MDVINSVSIFDQIKTEYKPVEILMTSVSPVLGVHVGPGVVGIGAYNE